VVLILLLGRRKQNYRVFCLLTGEINKMDEADQSKVDLLQEYLSEIKPYTQIKREYGAGELRLNKSIEFG